MWTEDFKRSSQLTRFCMKFGFVRFILCAGLIMFAKSLRMSLKNGVTVAKRTYKVGVAGAAGGIGQPLALLLKLDPNVSNLSYSM